VIHGQQEIEWWADQWDACGIVQEDLDTQIPWFVYRKECSKGNEYVESEADLGDFEAAGCVGEG